MHVTTLISALYGEARGYRRLRIRREVARHERLSREALARMARELFARRVREAAARWPGWAEHVRRRGAGIPARGPIDPADIPVWTRHDQRRFFETQPAPPESAYVHQTSGSTSLPVRFHVSRESYEWRTAIMDRAYGWAGAEEGRRAVHVWAAGSGALSVAARVKRTVHRVLQRRVVFDAFRGMGEAELRACCRLIDRFRPEALVGYTGILVDLARFVRDHPGALHHRPRALVSAAEGLQPGQRELLEAHLVDEVFLSYGSREFMNLGMECEHHAGYHLASDNVLVEVVDASDRPVEPGCAGRIVVTDLRNTATPFIRYEIGDIGVLEDPEAPCACGRPFPRLRSVDGRMQDMVETPDGRRVTALYVTYAMRQFDAIEGWQVVQHDPAHITVRLLSREPLESIPVSAVETLLRERLGPAMRIAFERADALVRRPTGKVALVASRAEFDRLRAMSPGAGQITGSGAP